LNVAVPPTPIVCAFGPLTMSIAGFVGVGVGVGFGAGFGGVSGALTVTGAESVAVTFGPLGGVPVATATFVKLAATFASEQL
jgi:hypothetical protein